MDKNINPPKPKLHDQMRDRLRYKHYSLSTEKVYLYWCRFYIHWSGMRHPMEMGSPEIEAFLTMLVSVRHVSAATHKQALSAILFLYKEVLQIDLPWMQQIGRPKTEQRLPTVLTALEVQTVLRNLEVINAEHALFA